MKATNIVNYTYLTLVIESFMKDDLKHILDVYIHILNILKNSTFLNTWDVEKNLIQFHKYLADIVALFV